MKIIDFTKYHLVKLVYFVYEVIYQ